MYAIWAQWARDTIGAGNSNESAFVMRPNGYIGSKTTLDSMPDAGGTRLLAAVYSVGADLTSPVNQLLDQPSRGRYDRANQVIDRRTALVDAAYKRIASDGFEGLRTRDVAADAGVNIATLHYYFPTKEALIRGVIGQAMQKFLETMPESGSAEEQLRGHLQALAQLINEDKQLWAVMGELVLRAPRDADLEHIFRQTDAYWHKALVGLIRRCVEDGSIDPEFEPDDTAALMIVAIKGLSLPTVSGFQPELADQVFRQFERLLGFKQRVDSA